MLSMVLDVILAKSRDEEVRVVVALQTPNQHHSASPCQIKTHLLVSQLQALDARCLDSLGKVLREKLSLLVKVVTSALEFSN